MDHVDQLNLQLSFFQFMEHEKKMLHILFEVVAIVIRKESLTAMNEHKQK